MNFALPRLYAIIDARQTAARGRSPLEVMDKLLAAGVRLIQYRDKQASAREAYQVAGNLTAAAHRANAKLIVNDRADVALAAGADGVHLGQDDLPASDARRILPPGSLIGLSTHSLSQAEASAGEPVDYIAFGPIFATGSKTNPDPVVGLQGVAAVREAVQKPLVAIGGITLDNARSVIEAGADSVAVIAGLLSASDIEHQARKFSAALGAG